MTDYVYSKVAVYAELGGAVRLARNSRSFATDPVTAAPINVTQGAFTAAYLDTDSSGIADFTATTPGPIRLTTGATFVDVYSEQLPGDLLAAAADAAASAASAAASAALVGAPADSAVAAIMGNGASASRVVTDGIYPQLGGIVVSALKFGAVGDGVTDNYAALTAALTAIKAAGPYAKARTLHLPGSGTYLTSAPILLDAANLTLRGDGKGTVLKLSASAGSNPAVTVSGTGCQVRDLTIDGNGLTSFTLKGTTADNLLVSDVTITGSTNHGVWLAAGDSITLRNVTALNCGTAAGANPAGFYTASCSNLVLDHCHSIGSYQHGYYLLGGSVASLTMTGCTATGNGGYGISARTSSQTLTGCFSWGNAWGAASFSYPTEPTGVGSRSVVTGCVFGGSTAPADCEVMSTGIDKTIFSNNVVDSAATAGVVRFQVTNGIAITGNIITTSYNGVIGALRINSSSNYVCADNSITGAGTGGSGISIDTSSSGKVANNKIDTFANAVTLTATVSNNVHVADNQCLNIIGAKVSNSSTGTGVVAVGNNLPNYYEMPVPVYVPLKANSSASGVLAIDAIASVGGSYTVMTENITSMTVANPTAGQRLTVILRQDTSGTLSIVWPTTFKFQSNTAPACAGAHLTTTVTMLYNNITSTWMEISRAINTPL